jgi:hypothetical protein
MSIRAILLVGLSVSLMMGGGRFAYGDDLEKRTEELAMIVFSADHRATRALNTLRSCPYATDYPLPTNGSWVGFIHEIDEGLIEDCRYSEIAEAGVLAEQLQKLKEDGARLVLEAHLVFMETQLERKNLGAELDSCVANVLGVSDVVLGKRITYDSGAVRDDTPPLDDDGSPVPGTAWTVTGLVRSWFTGSAENHGLLLRGHKETLEDLGDSSMACFSEVTNARLLVTVMRDPDPARVALPRDLVLAPTLTPTPTRTPGPVERDKQDVDVDVLIYKSPTPTHTLPGDSEAQPRSSGVVSKPSGSDLVRAVTSTPTRTPEPMVVPKPRTGITQ